MRTNKQLADAEREKDILRSSQAKLDLLLAADLQYYADRISDMQEGIASYEDHLRRLVRKALVRNWSLKRIAAFSGITKPRQWLEEHK